MTPNEHFIFPEFYFPKYLGFTSVEVMHQSGGMFDCV